MHRNLWLSLGILLLLAAVGRFPPAAGRAAEEDEGTVRDLVRRYAKDNDPAALKVATGLDVHHVLAMEHTILLVKDGKAEPVLDVDKHPFKLGDQIRVRIRAVTNAYLYIFTEGASGERVCLLPEKRRSRPSSKRAKRSTCRWTAAASSSFPPQARSLLRVVATDKPTEDLAALLNAVFKKQNLTPKEEELKQTIRAKIEARLQSISKQQEQTMAYRGLLTKEAMKEVRAKVDRAARTRLFCASCPAQPTLRHLRWSRAQIGTRSRCW